MLWMMMLVVAFTQQDDFIDYDKGLLEFNKSRRPFVVVITTKSCRFCGPMKNEFRQIKKDYPNFILSEISLADAQKTFDFIDFNRGVPQSFMYVYDNDTGKLLRMPTVVGFRKKDDIYKAWGMDK